MAQSTVNSSLDAYSPFFSSGLLATQIPRRGTIGWDEFASTAFPKASSSAITASPTSSPAESLAPSRNSSPCRPSSPRHDMVFDGESAMDVDIPEPRSIQKTRAQEIDDRRSLTPTPQTLGLSNGATRSGTRTSISKPSVDSASPQPNAQNTPRLRRRRSSLTQSTSPMNAIRSPTRAAGSALLLQMQLAGITTTSGVITRARSGSLNSGAGTENSSLMGRLRSGSCTNASSTTHLASTSTSATPSAEAPKPPFRPRRGVRGRVVTLPIPAPSPPPSAPLPALPTVSAAASNLLPSFNNLQVTPRASPAPPATSAKPPAATSARARGLSVSNSALGGEENTIEELKEF